MAVVKCSDKHDVHGSKDELINYFVCGVKILYNIVLRACVSQISAIIWLLLPVEMIGSSPGFGGGTSSVALRVLNTAGVTVRNKCPSVMFLI